MSASIPLVDRFLAAAGEPRPAFDRYALAGLLAHALERARAAWPSISLGDDAFVEHLARHVGGDFAKLETLRSADLYLARACAAADPVALSAFEAAHLPDLRAVYGQARGARPPLDEFVQMVRTKLFVGERPKILDYGGTGELKNWVRVTAGRVLVDWARQARGGESPIDDAGPLAVPAPGDDPELELLKRTYRTEIRQAFEEAARALSPEERNVLREHYALGLGIDQIALAHGIHRATAARRVAGAREAVLRGTRQILMQRLRLSRAELESVVRLVESQMYVTVERVLGAGE